MIRLLNKISIFFRKIYYCIYSVYFNFHYLPLGQAIKLPILLYKPRLLCLEGSISIEADSIHFGMIRLGGYSVAIFDDFTGFIWENKGGHIKFKGACDIGNGSALSVGAKSEVIFGSKFKATARCKIVSYSKITFGDNVLVGWECLFVDTDFHALTDIKTGKHKLSFKPILIGSNNWFAMKCTILKGTITPDYCTVGAHSVLNKKYGYDSKCLIAGNPATLKSNEVFWDIKNDKIQY